MLIKRFADVDRVDAVAGRVVRQRVVEGLHDKAGGDAGHAFALGRVAQLLNVDFLGPALLDDFLAVIELELGHQIALGGRLQARQDREHGGHFQSMRRDMGAEVRMADDLLINFHFFRKPQIVRHAHHDDAVEDRFVGVIGLEFLPFGFVGVGDDHGVDVDQAMPPGRRHDFLLGRGDHAVQVFDLVFEYLDKLNQAAVADVERAVQLQNSRIAFGVEIEFGNIFAADQHRGVLVVGVHRRHDADADPRALGKFNRVDRELFVFAVVLMLQFVAAHRTQVAFDVHAEHFFKLFAQVARNQMERLFEHRAAFDGIDRPRWLRGRDGVFRPESFFPSPPVP